MTPERKCVEAGYTGRNVPLIRDRTLGNLLAPQPFEKAQATPAEQMNLGSHPGADKDTMITTTEMPRTYINRRRAAMTDEQLTPEIQAVVEDLFLRWSGPEFPNITIFPDHSVMGSSLMLVVQTELEGNFPKRPGDSSHIDPGYTGQANRIYAARLRATRLVSVFEGWRGTKDCKGIPPYLQPGRTDVLIEMIQHVGKAQGLGIMWEIASSKTTRSLGVPKVDSQAILYNPNLIL